MHNRTELTEKILENLEEGILVISEEGNVIFVNKPAEVFFNLSGSEIIGKPFPDALNPDEENSDFYHLLCRLRENSAAPQVRTTYYVSGMDLLYIRIRTKILPDYGFVFFLEDITEHTEMRMRMQSMRSLENKNKFLKDTFGRYLSDEIVREITDTPDGLELGGKAVNLTVLMSDIRGSTKIADSMDANKYLCGLNHYLEEMTDVIHQYRGTVIELIGDSILAIFGTPIPCENHALQAVGAAVEMQRRMESVNAWNKENGFPVFSMGIGINTGDVIIGNIGSKRHAKYGVTGFIVNLCSRIEGYALGGQILAGDDTVSRIDVPLHIRSKVSISPKGSSSKFNLYDIYGIGSPFNISFDTYQEELTELNPTIPILYSVIESNKNVEFQTHPAQITRLSTTNAVIQTETPLEQRLDLQFKLSTSSIVYCKVTEVSGTTANIVFTSVPDIFLDWCSSLTKRFHPET